MAPNARARVARARHPNPRMTPERVEEELFGVEEGEGDVFFFLPTALTHSSPRMSRLRASVLGAVDGVITSFAIVAGSSAGSLTQKAVAVVGTSSLFADGLSMGVSEYLSSESSEAVQTEQAAFPPSTLGVVCFLSFVTAGSVPIAVYLASSGSLVASALASLLEMAGLGFLRSKATRQPAWKGVAQTTLLGASASLVAYGVGVAAHRSW